jgi:Ca-activated chloride channel homolog
MKHPAMLVAGALALVASAAGQNGQPPPQINPPTVATLKNPIRVQVNLVNVLFTVTDKKGRMVLTLNQDDFRLFEDNRPQTIRFFSRETDLPLRIGLLIDTSNSVRERLHFEQEAAIDFLNDTLRPGEDQAFVVSFDVEPQVLQDYTDNTDKLSGAIRSMKAGGGTALYDAVYYACKERIASLPSTGPYLRRVLIVVSDGLDNQSEHTADEALATAQRAEATIYAISTNNSGANVTEDRMHGNGSPGDKVLKYLAEHTGGRVFFPFEASDLASDFQQIARELRSQYSLAYVSTDQAHDGRFRVITLDTVEKGLRVRAKAGYFAPTQ